MTTVTENDLKKIGEKIDKLTDKFISEIHDIKITLVKVDEKITNLDKRLDSQDKSIQKIPDLAEKVGELKNWRSIALIVISGTITTLFWFFRNGKL
jgi:predicted component of type VI protein secretion system